MMQTIPPTWPMMWRVFGRIGLLSFGGPAAQIALMHRELVDRHKWLDEATYLTALSFCMLLPGPEAMQLATYAGWRLRGVAGGLLAGLLFVLPGAAFMLALAAIYMKFGALPIVESAFFGIKSCVAIIVFEALLRVGKRALKGRIHRGIAFASFAGLFALNLPFPLIILCAALGGVLLLPQANSGPTSPHRGHGHLLPALTLGACLWAAPLILAFGTGERLLFDLGLFFSKLALVTFGGAYAVLTYMAQDVVQAHGWLTMPEMMDALGLAETTPGPLILVTEFVGYVAAFKHGGPGAGVLAALMVVWVTFVPCFLWIFAFAPYVEQIRSRPRLQSALAGITAAVVGVIATLALWFSLHIFFGTLFVAHFGPLSLTLPVPASLDLGAIAIAALAGLMLLRLHWPLVVVLGMSALSGVALALI